MFSRDATMLVMGHSGSVCRLVVAAAKDPSTMRELKDTFVARLYSPRSHSDNTPSGYHASHAGSQNR